MIISFHVVCDCVYCHVFVFKRYYVCVCVDPLVCVSPPSDRVCIILRQEPMRQQRGLPHVDNVPGQKNVISGPPIDPRIYFCILKKKIKIKQTNLKIGNIPLFLVP